MLKILHHAAVDRTLRKFRHPFCHHIVVASRSAKMIVHDSLLYRLPEFFEIGVEDCHIVLEQRLFHGHEGGFPLYNVTGIPESIFGVIHMKLEIVEIIDFETAFFLCRSRECSLAQNWNYNLFHKHKILMFNNSIKKFLCLLSNANI